MAVPACIAKWPVTQARLGRYRLNAYVGPFTGNACYLIHREVAARLARALDRWKRLVEPYRSAACEALKRVAAKTDLSNDVREVVDRALAD